MLPKISTGQVRCTSVTDGLTTDRQTDGRRSLKTGVLARMTMALATDGP